LAELAHAHDLSLFEDAGSGLLVDGKTLSLEGEDTVQACLQQGIDLISFSGDKLLGGPQIGVLAGKRVLIERMKNNPLMRAVRVDKMSLAAFEAVLRLYQKGDWREIPGLAMLTREEEDMERQARDLARRIAETLERRGKVSAIPAEDAVGGGAYPERPLKGWGVSLAEHPAGGAGKIQALLRARIPAIVAGAHENALLFHVRTLLPGDEDEIVRALSELVRTTREKPLGGVE
jgi:L-seryl-tRNA(Ser) seleniumtransferase